MGHSKYSAEQWSVWIDQHRVSGLTIAAFCQSIGVTENSFYVWRRKLRSDRLVASRSGKLSAKSFVPLSVVKSGGVADEIKVELLCGAVVHVPDNEQLIRQTLEVLLESGTTAAAQAARAGSSSC